jgi:hypothetical protein
MAEQPCRSRPLDDAGAAIRCAGPRPKTTAVASPVAMAKRKTRASMTEDPRLQQAREPRQCWHREEQAEPGRSGRQQQALLPDPRCQILISAHSALRARAGSTRAARRAGQVAGGYGCEDQCSDCNRIRREIERRHFEQDASEQPGGGQRTKQFAGLVAGVGLAGVLARALLALPAASNVGRDLHIYEPVTYAIGLACIAIPCVLAACLPALRAARIDPTTTLRAE